MSSLIVKEVDEIYTPDTDFWRETWHKMNIAVPGGIALDGSNVPNVFCPIVESGFKLDLEIDWAGVPAEVKEALGDNPLANWKMLVADCRNGKAKSMIPLHVPKRGYKTHQNIDCHKAMIGAATQVLGEGKFEIVSIGTTGAYSQFFESILVKDHQKFSVGRLPKSNVNDEHHVFFNLNTSHNGLISSNRALSIIRQVCFNTINASIADAENNGTIASIKHTAGSEGLITPEQFAKDLKNWLAGIESFKAMLQALKAEKMTEDEFKFFTAGVFTNDGSDNLSTTSYNRVDDMIPLFKHGRGNSGETRFDGVQAFTEYFTSGNGVGNRKTVSAGRRIATANFGKGNDWKLEAIRIATNEEEFAATVKRGEKFWTDKHAVVMAGN